MTFFLAKGMRALAIVSNQICQGICFVIGMQAIIIII